MEMRRRDGVQWSSVTGDYYRVQVPAHVSPGGQLIKPDLALFKALLESRERLESLAWSGLHRGIVLFNQANTDAPDMSPDTELVLTCSAIEQVLGITSRQDQRQFPAKFAEAWHPDREVPQSEWQGPAHEQARDERHPAGLLGFGPEDLPRELGARAPRGRTAVSVDGSPTPAVDLLHCSPARQASSVRDGRLYADGRGRARYQRPRTPAEPTGRVRAALPGGRRGGLPERRLRVAVGAAARAGPPVALPRRFQTVNAVARVALT